MEDQLHPDSQLQQAMTQLLEAQTASEARERELHERLLRAEAALEAARQNTPTTPAIPTPRAPQDIPKKHILPKPRGFDGTKSRYPAWRIQMEQKLEIDGEAIAPSETGRIFFILGYLEGDATSFVESWDEIRNTSPKQVTLKGLWNELDLRFLDQQRQQKALTQWKTSRQQKQPLAEYLLEYERLERESGMSKVTSQARIMNLESRLSGEIMTVAMTRGNRHQSFPKYVQALQDIEADLQTLRATGALRFNPFRGESTSNRTNPRTSPRTQQAQAAPASATPIQTPRKLASNETEAMDWEATASTNQFNGNRLHRILLPEDMRNPSQKELRARKNAGACFNCGNVGHIAKRCQYQYHNVTLNTISMAIQDPPKPVRLADDEDTESENE